MKLVTRRDIKKGLSVVDSEGKKGKIVDCKDLHNVHVIFEGSGLLIEVDGKEIDCGGSGLYCFEICKDNIETTDPLYIRQSKIKIDRIDLDKNNRMLRIGFGKHEGKWFFRIDLWWRGYRFKSEN